jgi:hypothetical protein
LSTAAGGLDRQSLSHPSGSIFKHLRRLKLVLRSFVAPTGT